MENGPISRRRNVKNLVFFAVSRIGSQDWKRAVFREFTIGIQWRGGILKVETQNAPRCE